MGIEIHSHSFFFRVAVFRETFPPSYLWEIIFYTLNNSYRTVKIAVKIASASKILANMIAYARFCTFRHVVRVNE